MDQQTIEIRLEGPDDINSALEMLRNGHQVFAVAGSSMRRPKSDLLHDLVHASSVQGFEVRHPHWVCKGFVRTRAYMRSCFLVPIRPEPGESSGVREPRRPRPNPPSLRAEQQLDFGPG